MFPDPRSTLSRPAAWEGAGCPWRRRRAWLLSWGFVSSNNFPVCVSRYVSRGGRSDRAVGGQTQPCSAEAAGHTVQHNHGALVPNHGCHRQQATGASQRVKASGLDPSADQQLHALRYPFSPLPSPRLWNRGEGPLCSTSLRLVNHITTNLLA